jgi:hypothetical protein
VINYLQRFDTHLLRPTTFVPDNIAVLKEVRRVIKTTDVPSWISPVSRDWGSKSAGTPKADDWRTMATIYFPIALIQCWSGSFSDAEGKNRRQLLELTMCLVQATCLAFRKHTDKDRRAAYLQYMCTYLHNLQSVSHHGCPVSVKSAFLSPSF